MKARCVLGINQVRMSRSWATKFSPESGSALVESLGVIALTALVLVGLLQLGFVTQRQSSLAHAAAMAARAGAIADDQAARTRLAELVPSADSRLREVSIGGLDLYEVEVTETLRTIMGERQVRAVAHAKREKNF